MEFYDSIIPSGAHRVQRARIAIVPAQHSWVALPGPLVSSLLDSGAELPIAIRLNLKPASAFAQRISRSPQQQQQQQISSTPTPRYVAWAGAVSAAAGTLEVPAGLAAALQLPAGVEVVIELLPTLAAAAAVVVEPVSAADWEVVEVNASLLEELLLNQAGVVCVGQPFPLWARQARVSLRITSIMHWPDAAAAAAATAGGSSGKHLILKNVAKLVHGTELHIAPKPRLQPGNSLNPGQLPLAASSRGAKQQQQGEPAGQHTQQQQQQQREAVWLRVQDASMKYLLNTAGLQQQVQYTEHGGSNSSSIGGSSLASTPLMNGSVQHSPANGSSSSNSNVSNGNSKPQALAGAAAAAAAADATSVLSWVTTAVYVSPATAKDLQLAPGELVRVFAHSMVQNPNMGNNPSALPLQSIVLLLQLDTDVAWGHVAVAPPLQQCLTVAPNQYIKLQAVHKAVQVLQQLPGLVLHPLLPAGTAGSTTVAAEGSLGSTAGLATAVTAAAAVPAGSTGCTTSDASLTARCSIHEIEELPNDVTAGSSGHHTKNTKQQQQQQGDSFTGVGLVQEVVAELLSKPLRFISTVSMSQKQQPNVEVSQQQGSKQQQQQQQQVARMEPAADGAHQLLQPQIVAAAINAWLQLQAMSAAAAAAAAQASPSPSALSEPFLPCYGPLLIHFSLQQQQEEEQAHGLGVSNHCRSNASEKQQQQHSQDYLMLLLPHPNRGAASKEASELLNNSSNGSTGCHVLPLSLLIPSSSSSSSAQQLQVNVRIAGTLIYDPAITSVSPSAAAVAHRPYLTHISSSAAAVRSASCPHLHPDSYPWLNPALQSCLARLNPRLSLLSWQAWQSVQLPLPGGVLVVGANDGGRGWLLQLLGQAAAAGHSLNPCVHTIKVACKGLAGQSYDAAVAVLSAAAAEAVACCPGLLLLDDLDMLTPATTGEGPAADQQDQTTATRLAEWLVDLMHWAAQQQRPVSFAATCSAAAAVPAALRAAGCFDHNIKVPPFGVRGRAALLLAGIQAKGLGFTGGISEIEGLAGKQLEGFDARDLQLVVDRAVHAALRRDMAHSDADDSNASRDGSQQQRRRQGLEVTAADVSEGLAGFVPAAFWRAGQQKGQQQSEGGVQGWEDVGGLSAAVAALHEALVMPAKYGQLLAAAPLRLRTGLLLFGPPGCGKTHVVAAAVAATGARLISVKGPELLNKYIGQSEAAVRDLFARAAAAAPCVLFFDEFDAIAPPRGHDSTGVTDRVVNQLLTELDGVEGLTGVAVLAATSRPDLIDAALLRPGRLDRMVCCGFPDESDRLSILKACARKVALGPNVDFTAIAAHTVNFSGADLSAILSEAQLLAVHEQLDKTLQQCKDDAQSADSSSSSSRNGDGGSSGVVVGVPVITTQHLQRALARARPSLPPSEQRRLAAVYARFQQGRDPGISNRQLLDEQQQRVKHATLA